MTRSHLFAALSSAVLIAACAGIAERPAARKVACTDKLDAPKHADLLPTKLLRRDSASKQLMIGGVATLVPLKDADKLDEADFRDTAQAVAILTLSVKQGKLDTGTYCMKSRLVKANVNDTSAWTVTFHRRISADSFDVNAAYRPIPLVAYWGDSLKEVDQIRPSARIMWYTPAKKASPGATPDDSLNGPREDDGGSNAAWYRCGAGCCGASLAFDA